MILPNKVGMIPFHMYSPTVIWGALSQIASGMNVMLATAWSNPSETNANVGPHIPTTLDARSWPWKPKKQAKHTSQLQPIPRKSILWNSGISCFFVAKEITADLKGSTENISPSVDKILVKWKMNLVRNSYSQIWQRQQTRTLPGCPQTSQPNVWAFSSKISDDAAPQQS